MLVSQCTACAFYEVYASLFFPFFFNVFNEKYYGRAASQGAKTWTRHTLLSHCVSTATTQRFKRRDWQNICTFRVDGDLPLDDVIKTFKIHGKVPAGELGGGTSPVPDASSRRHTNTLDLRPPLLMRSWPRLRERRRRKSRRFPRNRSVCTSVPTVNTILVRSTQLRISQIKLTRTSISKAYSKAAACTGALYKEPFGEVGSVVTSSLY